MRTNAFATLAAVLAVIAPPATAAATSPALAAAVADCRRLAADAPLEKQQRFSAAVKALVAAREEGVQAVEAELAELRAAKETDVLFQSVAAEVILAVREGNGFAAALEAARGIAAISRSRRVTDDTSLNRANFELRSV